MLKVKVALAVLVLAAVALYGFHYITVGFFPYEDAYISLGFARSFLETGWLSISGGPPHFEGFSSPPWVLLLAASGLVSGDLPLNSLVLCWILSAATLLVTYLTARRLCPSVAAVAPAIIVMAPSFWGYGQAGMEAPLFMLEFALFAHLGVAWLQGPRSEERPGRDLWFAAASAGLLAALATTRPDGLILGGILGLGLTLCLWRGGRSRPAVLGVGLVGFLGLWGGFQLWRHVTFGSGQLLAWTVIWKSQNLPQQWGERLASGLAFIKDVYLPLGGWFWLTLVFALLPPGEPGRSSASIRWLRWVLLLTIILLVAMVAAFGGDHFGVFGDRHLLHISPLLVCALLIQRSMCPPARSGRLTLVFMIALLLLVPARHLGMIYSDRLNMKEADRVMIARDEPMAAVKHGVQGQEVVEKEASFRSAVRGTHWRYLAAWLRAHSRPEWQLASFSAGEIAYYSGLPFIDLDGLTTHHRRDFSARAQGHSFFHHVTHKLKVELFCDEMSPPSFIESMESAGYHLNAIVLSRSGKEVPRHVWHWREVEGDKMDLLLFSRFKPPPAKPGEATIEVVLHGSRFPLARDRVVSVAQLFEENMSLSAAEERARRPTWSLAVPAL